MKKISLLLILIISQQAFSQHSIKFEESSFASILAKAKAEKKLVFMDAYASWCGPCKLMEKNVFTDKNVADFYNKNFVNARIDMEKGEGRDLAIKYGVRSYPTFLFLNGEGDVVGNACLHHLHAVLIGQGNGFLTEYVYPVLRRLDDRVLVKVIGGCHDYRVHVFTAV